MLRIHFRRSYWFALSQTAAHVGAAVSTIPLDLPLPFKAALGAAIALSFIHALRCHAFRTCRNSIVALELRNSGATAAQTRDGTWHDATVRGTSYVTPLLTVLNLNLRDSRFSRHVVVLPDMLSAEEFRTLRVILRWQHAHRSIRTRSDTDASTIDDAA